MVERGGESRFATESLRRLPRVGAFRRDHFDSDDAVERGFYALVDDRHTAAAELFLNLVVMAELFLDHGEELIAARLHDVRGNSAVAVRSCRRCDRASGWCRESAAAISAERCAVG